MKAKTSISKEIQQPGGNLDVSADWKCENIESIKLNGLVHIVSEGIVYV